MHDDEKTGAPAIDPAAVLAYRDVARSLSFTDRDTILYALGAGMGRDPLDARELRYVVEGEGFTALPTLAVVVAPSRVARALPIDYAKVLHGEQSLTLHRSMPTAGELVADTRVTRLLDKGAGKGALIYAETEVRLRDDDQPLFTAGITLFARGDGGFGGRADGAPPPHAIPDRAPDLIHVTETRRDQALIYRLSGDRNPLHADPEAARRAGFPGPILHGLCTYAIACRAVLASICGYDASLIASFDVRFTSPVFPGDTIVTDIWRDGTIVSFRCRVPARGVTVIDNGRCALRADRTIAAPAVSERED